MRDTSSTLPESKTGSDSSDKNGVRARTSYVATITPRTLPSDTLAPFPVAKPEAVSEPAPTSKHQVAAPGRRRIIRIEFVVGVLAVLGVGFLLVPKKVVKHIVPTASSAGAIDADDVDFAPGSIGENSPAAPLARNAEEWVKTAAITGVRKTRILINGKVHKLNEPIPPFRVVWTGNEAGTLTFRSVGGAEYFRQTK